MFVAFGLITLYGVVDELHQGLVPGRTFDLKDLAADVTGGIVACLLIYFYFRRKTHLNNSVSY
jgi:VanZ family protein